MIEIFYYKMPEVANIAALPRKASKGAKKKDRNVPKTQKAFIC